jgi:hypothetical protein
VLGGAVSTVERPVHRRPPCGASPNAPARARPPARSTAPRRFLDSAG